MTNLTFKIIIYSIALLLISGFLMFAEPVSADDAVLGVTQIAAIKTFASADGTYANGWSWLFDVTAPANDTILNMKFSDWVNGSNVITAANHIRFYSAQSSNAYDQSHAIAISATDTYSGDMNLASDLNPAQAGRQIQITVEIMVPPGSNGGSYSTSYGIQTNPSIILSDDATVASAVYTVSPLVNGVGTISNVPFGTSKATFEANLSKGQADQTWNDNGITNPVITGNTLMVTAQDSVTTAIYAIDVNPELPDPDDVAQVQAAKNALPSTLNPVYGVDSNIIVMAQAIVDAASSGVVVTISSSNNSRILTDGSIIYDNSSHSGNVTFVLTKNSANDAKVILVIVPALSNNAAITSAVYTVSPLVNGVGTISNVPFATAKSVFEANLTKGQANQTWNDVGITNPVTTGNALVVTAQNGTTTATYTIAVDDDLSIYIAEVAKAKAALPSELNPVYGIDDNVITMAQAIVNTVSSGVAVTISSSNNSRILTDGTVIYFPPGSSISGNVTFTLTKNSASDTKDILVTVITPL